MSLKSANKIIYETNGKPEVFYMSHQPYKEKKIELKHL